MKLKSIVTLLMLVLLAACGGDPAQPAVETEPEPEPTAVPTEPPTAVPTEVVPTAVVEEPTAEPEPTATPTVEPTAISTEESAEEPTEEVVEEVIEADVVVDDNAANIGTGRQFTVPGDNVYPEGVSYDPTTGNFYVGGTADGTLFVGNVNGSDEMTVFSPAGADGRTNAVGTKIDADGNLWVAGGETGQIFVYSTVNASLVASFTAPGAGFINDMAITDDGVYFTDSWTPTLWRVTDLTQGEAEAWLDFTDTAITYVDGLNLNGIVATADGSTLITVHSGEGELYRIDVASQTVSRIDTGTIPLTAGDGMLLIDNTLYVTRNEWWEIVQIELSDDQTVGTGGEVTYSELFIYPTTIASTGNTLLVVNAQFNNLGAPSLPFTIAQIPLPSPAVTSTLAEIVVDETFDDNVANIGTGRLFTLPGDNIYPEGVSYDPATGNFYVGATADGTLFVGNVNGDDEMTVFSEGGADGRTNAVGTKVDADGNLWVAGGDTGQIFVYDTADGSLVASFTTPGSGGFINDIAITDAGVYFTDSFRSILWRVTDLAQGEAEAWLDFTGTAINYVDGFNLNGIVASEDGSALIVVHSGEGELYHIDVASQAVARIDTGTIGLTAGDGMALVGNAIYVTRNSIGEIVRLELSADYTVGVGGETITSELFAYPTTIAFTGNTFLVVNSQFDSPNAPNLPFTIAQIPLAQVTAATSNGEIAAGE